MRHMSMILRQVRHSSQQAGLFVLCVALSLATLTAFSGFSRSMQKALREDARTLQAADVIIRSYDPIPLALTRTIDQLTDQGRILSAAIHEFYTVVRAPEKSTSVLSSLKVVEPGYPFYGRVRLRSGREFKSVLSPGTCIVEQTLLDRTELSVGADLKVGYTTLRIVDVVTAEPDRPLELFSLGPRVFINAADLDALGLMGTGSRIRRIVQVKVLDTPRVDAVAEQFKQAISFDDDTVRIHTFLSGRSAIKRFLDNFLFFLKLVGLFILIVSGLGIQSTLKAFLDEKQRTIAIIKTVGATGRFITIHFMLLVLLLGGVGTTVGILAGVAAQSGLVRLLDPFLPDHLVLTLSWVGIAEAIALGFTVVVLFSLLPLYRTRQMRPLAIFNRQSSSTASRWPDVLSGLLVLLFFLGLVLWHMQDIRFGIYFVGAITAMILVAALLAQTILAVIRRLPIRHLILRQAIRGLFRRGNATRAIMITLTVALAVIFGDSLIEKNLNATFVRSFPANSSNAFFVDVQPDQTEDFATAMGRPVQFFPIIRAQLTAVNDQAIDRRQERRKKRRDNLSRVFNLTYRETLLDDERLIDGKSLFREDWTEPQVSVMDTVVDMHPMQIGDRLHFKIQGVPLTARISSIRIRDSRSLSPFFYFVFPTAVLGKAPQTFFTALSVPQDQMGAVQLKIASQFPNISVIDLSQTIATFVRLMGRLARILRSFSVFSIAAGILILVSAVLATRAERMVESVYYKILGAGRRFVLGVFAVENLLIGMFSSGLALVMAQAGAWYVCTVRLDISYHPFIPASLVMIGLTVLLTVGVGMVASRSIVSKKPVVYLREQQNE
ncbi:putative ABC transporter, permease protein [Desulfosarcina variabilis str. Montpellier]|uniref:ABC transporter permease n=1 Tax=Desulfosarcina variabilis TaxID=2300 RepID=UPI003AFA15E4